MFLTAMSEKLAKNDRYTSRSVSKNVRNQYCTSVDFKISYKSILFVCTQWIGCAINGSQSDVCSVLHNFLSMKIELAIQKNPLFFASVCFMSVQGYQRCTCLKTEHNTGSLKTEKQSRSVTDDNNNNFLFQLNPSDKTLEHKRDFRIKHYAGDVTYSVVGFIDKNKDTLFQDFKRLLFNRYVHNCSCSWNCNYD